MLGEVGEVGEAAVWGFCSLRVSFVVVFFKFGEEGSVGEEISGSSSLLDRPLDSLEPLYGAGRWAHGGVGSSTLTIPRMESFHLSLVSTRNPSLRQQSFPSPSTTTS